MRDIFILGGLFLNSNVTDPISKWNWLNAYEISALDKDTSEANLIKTQENCQKQPCPKTYPFLFRRYYCNGWLSFLLPKCTVYVRMSPKLIWLICWSYSERSQVCSAAPSDAMHPSQSDATKMRCHVRTWAKNYTPLTFMNLNFAAIMDISWQIMWTVTYR